MSIDIGIDLGTYKIAVYIKNKGIVFNQPSVIAYNIKNKNIVAVGTQAYNMIGKTPRHIKIIRPFLNGVVHDYDFAEKMLINILNKVCYLKILKPRIAVCISAVVTDIEKNALIDLAISIGAKKVFVIDAPIASALGVNVDILQSKGRLVLDIGAGSCDIEFIALGGVVIKDSIKIAGDDFDDAIIKTIKTKYSLEIGQNIARNTKHKICLVSNNKYIDKKYIDDKDNFELVVKGKDVFTGLPRVQKIYTSDFIDEFELISDKIINLIKTNIKKLSPDIVSDIQSESILFTGGSAKLRGLKEKIEEQIKIKVFVPENSSETVVIGLNKSFDFTKKINSGMFQKNAYKK